MIIHLQKSKDKRMTHPTLVDPHNSSIIIINGSVKEC